MRLAVILLSLICPLAPAVAQQSTPASGLEDPPWVRDVRDKKMVYAVPGMADVQVRKDVVYKQVEGWELKADIYLPSGLKKGEKRPVIIFIHGGYLPPNLLTPPKEWVEYRSFGRLAGTSGFVGVVFNHRFFRNFGGLPDSEADLADMISFVREHAEAFSADKDRITLWAFSGGGYLFSRFLREPPAYIRALVAYYAVLDFTPEERAAPERAPADLVQKFSAVQALAGSGKQVPPILVARAGLDHPLRNATIDHFIKVALEKNAAIQVVNHPSGHHGFDVEDDNDVTRKIIQATLDFVRERN